MESLVNPNRQLVVMGNAHRFKGSCMINIAIIGCGHWGPNFIRNFNQEQEACLYEVCDVTPGRLEYVQQIAPHVRVSSDYNQLLKNDEIDAVVISSPAATHYGIAKECLLKDKHVLVEKPLATEVDLAEEIVELARKRKKILMVGHTFKYNPAVQKMKQFIKNKELGQIYYVYSRRTNLGPLRRDVSAMWDLAPHDISILSYLLEAQPCEVVAKGQKYLQHNLEDVTFITLTYPGGILANIHVSWLDPRKVREVTVVGDEKMMVFDDLNIAEPIRIYDKKVVKKKFKQDYSSFEEFQMIIKDGSVFMPKVQMEEPLKIECKHFLDCVRNGKKPLTDGQDGVEVVRVLTAVQKSLERNGDTIRLS